jgi:dipeptidase E
MRALLLSNSTSPGHGYLSHAQDWLISFLSDVEGYAAFIPFAGVTISQEDYTEKVQQAFNSTGLTVKRVPIEDEKQSKEVIRNAAAILVGGGNTFRLLHAIRELGLFELIQEKVHAGTHYVGWSAGSNVAGKSIRTTNDMPIIQPASFGGLNFFPHQINPHYTEATLEGHGGESRKDRLNEFIELNNEPVLCLPEGTALKIQNNQFSYLGERDGIWMTPKGNQTITEENINQLISK